MSKSLTKTQKQNLVKGLGSLAKAFVRGAAAKKARPKSGNNNLSGVPEAKPGCGPCGPRSK